MEVARPWLVGREEVSEDGDWEPLPGRREKSLPGLPGSRGWYLAKEVGLRIVGKRGVDKQACSRGGISCLTRTRCGWGGNAGTFERSVGLG